MNNFFRVKKLFLRLPALRRSVLLIFFITLCIPGLAASAESQRGFDIPPDAETRSIIGPAEGFFDLTGGVSLDTARQMALKNAKKEFLNIAKKTIRSRLHVRGKPPVYDIARMDLEDVAILHEKDVGVVNPGNKYHVEIEAKVVYVLKKKPGAATHAGSQAASVGNKSSKVVIKTHEISSVFSDPNAPLTVRVWTDKKEFSEGEDIKLYVQGNRDFYARIVNLDSDGNMIQLLPNQFRQSRFFKGKKVYVVPDDSLGDRFTIVSTPPYGIDTIVTFASEAPLGEVNLTPIGQGLGQFRGSKKKFSDLMTRGMKVVGKDNKTPVGFYESTWKFKTIPKDK